MKILTTDEELRPVSRAKEDLFDCAQEFGGKVFRGKFDGYYFIATGDLFGTTPFFFPLFKIFLLEMNEKKFYLSDAQEGKSVFMEFTMEDGAREFLHAVKELKRLKPGSRSISMFCLKNDWAIYLDEMYHLALVGISKNAEPYLLSIFGSRAFDTDEAIKRLNNYFEKDKLTIPSGLKKQMLRNYKTG